MFHDQVAKRLSRRRAELLLEHIDHPREVREKGDTLRSLKTMAQEGLLYFTPPDSPRPHFSNITLDGRQVLATILGNYAEALIRAGYTVDAVRTVPPAQPFFNLSPATCRDHPTGFPADEPSASVDSPRSPHAGDSRAVARRHGTRLGSDSGPGLMLGPNRA